MAACLALGVFAPSWRCPGPALWICLLVFHPLLLTPFGIPQADEREQDGDLGRERAAHTAAPTRTESDTYWALPSTRLLGLCPCPGDPLGLALWVAVSLRPLVAWVVLGVFAFSWRFPGPALCAPLSIVRSPLSTPFGFPQADEHEQDDGMARARAARAEARTHTEPDVTGWALPE